MSMDLYCSWSYVVLRQKHWSKHTGHWLISVCVIQTYWLLIDLIIMEKYLLFTFFTVVTKYKCVLYNSGACNICTIKVEEVHVDYNE